MKPYKAQAMRLRIQGKSYNEISKVIPVAKSTLSLWLRDTVLSDAAGARLKARERELGAKELIKRNKLQTHTARQRAREASRNGAAAIRSLHADDLLIIGAALYWAEGYKRLRVRDGKERVDHPISLVNSDPKMIAAFVRFLREALHVAPESIRLSMRLYAHINETEARRFWMRAAGLSAGHFLKTTYLISRASKGIRPFNRLPWGTLQVAVYDTQKFHYLLGLIEGVKNQIGCATILPLLG